MCPLLPFRSSPLLLISLLCDRFFMFVQPVDLEEAPDYLNIIQDPMDLETIMSKIDRHEYACAADFLADVDLVCRNALEYNPDRSNQGKMIRHRACYLHDTAHALIKAEMDSDFEDQCKNISQNRKKRAFRANKLAPDFVYTAPVKENLQNIAENGNFCFNYWGLPSILVLNSFAPRTFLLFIVDLSVSSHVIQNIIFCGNVSVIILCSGKVLSIVITIPLCRWCQRRATNCCVHFKSNQRMCVHQHDSGQ